MSTFQERLKSVIGIGGYEPCMRRSVQSVLLVEAQRCVKDKLPSLRPFQKKVAFWDQALALLNTLDFIPPHYKTEIMWRTASSKEILQADAAWKRSRLIERELAKLAEKIKPYMEGNSHAEACDLLVQELYETTVKQENSGGISADGQIKTRPVNWIHAHNNVWLAFRLYYKGDQLDPDFPPAIPPKEIIVPQHKKDASVFLALPGAPGAQGGFKSEPGDVDSVDRRKKVLSEVRDHLELLKEFEGIVPEEELNRRKRELFMALPAAPPAASNKGGAAEPPAAKRVKK